MRTKGNIRTPAVVGIRIETARQTIKTTAVSDNKCPIPTQAHSWNGPRVKDGRRPSSSKKETTDSKQYNTLDSVSNRRTIHPRFEADWK